MHKQGILCYILFRWFNRFWDGNEWQHKVRTHKRVLQSLVGLLLYISINVYDLHNVSFQIVHFLTWIVMIRFSKASSKEKLSFYIRLFLFINVARNIWMLPAIHDIGLHIPWKMNFMADTLSRWFNNIKMSRCL